MKTPIDRRGFSLLELLLTLALAVVLMSMVGAAFSFYATRLDVRDTEVRRVQLAQAILDMIADDLRGAIHPPEFDDAALSQLLSSAAGGAAGGATPGAGQDLSAAGLDDASGDDLSGEDPASMTLDDPVEVVDLSTGTMTSERPGLLGNQTQLQFEVSHLPRIEEYQPIIDPAAFGETTDVPSDIKTVTYYLQPAGGGVTDPLQNVAGVPSSTAAASMNPSGGGGLVRRSIDRAITKWALENGAMTSLLSSGDLIATEVVGLEFQYWDGFQWQMSWDSDAAGTLPQAIQVTLTMLEAEPAEAAAGFEPATRVYQHIIRLPMGRPLELTETEDLSAAGL
ncbi:prepilin-type N-terminal cleavage/methylation domain-containing protein [Candidatus Laterigemmans baculatus]|uniref:prepilin-type N-terminal cleavage/methylation domain-containing protein n=1 Tax=Candidatus Laterigemmans baculatus TaxID=2770505 RepID=UPI0013DB0A73|nr:prepilin-type N-terminal cleavage/methylation domain-containing protein [Candidatus Laterigemmans baculatus]